MLYVNLKDQVANITVETIFQKNRRKQKSGLFYQKYFLSSFYC